MPSRNTRRIDRRLPRLGWRCLALWLCLTVPLGAQKSREYDLKAVFLYNFATFVEWPKEARPAEGEPLVIGILGHDPFGPVLDEVLKGEVLNGCPLVARRVRSIDDAERCHILYISSSEAERMPRIVAALRDKPVLTVADTPRAAAEGVMISFDTGDRVQLHVNPRAAQQAGLSVSSKLLRVATVVGRADSP